MVLKLLKLLPESYRKRLFSVALSILASTLLSLVGIAVILPIFILLLGGGNLSSYPFLNSLRESIAPESIKNFIFILSGVILVVLVVKFYLTILLSKFQTKYILNIYKYFSEKLYLTYYNRGYLFVKENGTTDLAYKINSVCYAAATLVFQPTLIIAAESAIAIITFVGIAIISPFASLAVVVSVIPVCILYMGFIRQRLIQYGRLENRARNNQFRIVTETFNGYPSIKLSQAFPKMHTKFSNGLNDLTQMRLKSTIINKYYGLLIEIAIIICVVVLLLTSSQDWGTLSISIACFGAGALRILPALRSIMSSYSQIKNNSYAVETILESINYSEVDNKPIQKESIQFEKEIKVSNLSFEFNDRGVVLDNLTFAIQKGEKVGIRGVSGAGKSTLFNLMLGLYKPKGGAIKVDDNILSEGNVEAWQEIIGYVPQEVPIHNASIAENIAFSILFNTSANIPLTVRDLLYNKSISSEHFEISSDVKERIYWAMEQAQLTEFVDSLPDGIYTVIGENGAKISGGQKQRIGIARALFKNPQILFFDEATSSLDPQMEREVNDAITAIASSNDNLTMVIIAHRPESMAMCNRVIDIPIQICKTAH